MFLKRIIALCVIGITVLAVNAQSGTTVNLPDENFTGWNWENQSYTYWNQVSSINRKMENPFNPITDRLGHLADVYLKGDYTRAKGWTLVWASFTGTYPYFVLYNPHRSIVRAFFSLEDYPYHHLLATIKMVSDKPSGILTKGNIYQQSAEYYQGGGKNDMISVIIPDAAPNGWCCADFNMTFDPNISSYSNQLWEFQFFGCDTYDLTLFDKNGKMEFDQSEARSQVAMYTNSGQLFSDKFVANTDVFESNMTSTSDMLAKFVASGNSITAADPEFMQDYKRATMGFKDIAELASNVSAVAKGVCMFVSFFNSLTGVVSEEGTSTSKTRGTYLEGKISIEKTLAGTTLKVPGTAGAFKPEGLKWSPYDCAMGNVTLKRTPRVRKTTEYEKYTIDSGTPGTGSYQYQNNRLYRIVGIPNVPVAVTPVVQIDNNNRIPDKFHKYKLDEDIQVSINEAPGMKLTDIHFAFDFKIKRDAYWNIQTKNINMLFYDGDGKSFYLPILNPIYKALEDGRLKIYSIDGDYIEIGTPLAKMNELKGIVFEAPINCKVGLKVITRFSSNLYDAPIIHSALYDLAEVMETANVPILYWRMEQSNYKWTDFFIDNSPITLNTFTNTKKSASTIYMTTGFSAGPGFVAETIGIFPNNGNTLLDYSSFDCYTTSLKSGNFISDQPSEIEAKTEDISISGDVNIFPNPSKGNIFIVADTSTITSINIINQYGLSVYNTGDINHNQISVDLSEIPNGHYIAVITCGTSVYQKRVVLMKN